jgi:hypothetical protein
MESRKFNMGGPEDTIEEVAEDVAETAVDILGGVAALYLVEKGVETITDGLDAEDEEEY